GRVRRGSGLLLPWGRHDVRDDRVIVVDVEHDVAPQQVLLRLRGRIVRHLFGLVPADVAVQHVRDLTDPVGAARVGAEFRGQLGLAAVDASRGQGDPGGGGAAPITGFLYLVVDVEDDLTRRAHVGCGDGGCLGGGRGRHRTDQRN